MSMTIKGLTIKGLERHYIPCPHLKCEGFKDTEVCYYKCIYYKIGSCDTIQKLYEEAGYE